MLIGNEGLEARRDIVREFFIARHKEIVTSLNVATVLAQASARKTVGSSSVLINAGSDIHVSLEVESERVVAVALDGESSGFSHRLDAGATGAGVVRPECVQSLFSSCQSVLWGAGDPRLIPADRLLISAVPWASGTRRKYARLTAVGAASLFRRSVVLGGPGSGKSTLLRRIANLHLGALAGISDGTDVGREGWWLEGPRTVLFVEWAELAESRFWPREGGQLFPHDVIAFSIARDPDLSPSEKVILQEYMLQQLHKGGVLLLGDGIDEIVVGRNNPQWSLNVVQNLTDDLLKLNERNQIIVTSRPFLSYHELRLTPVLLPGLGVKEQADFVDRFLSLGEGYREHANSYSLFLRRSATVPSDLRSQPLFLTLLVALFLSTEAELPGKRGTLLNAFLLLLLGEWSERRLKGRRLTDLLGCEPDALVDRLSAVAFKIHSRRVGSEPASVDPVQVPMGDVLEELSELAEGVDIREVLEFITVHAGILISPEPRKFTFAHRVFQEYLAALWIAKNDPSFGSLSQFEELTTPWWTEVIRLLADILNTTEGPLKVWSLIDFLCSHPSPKSSGLSVRHVWLACRIVEDQELRGVENRMIEFAAGVLRAGASQALAGEQLIAAERRDVGRCLGLLGDTRSGIRLTNEGLPDIKWCSIPAGEFLYGSSQADIEALTTDARGVKWSYERETPQFTLFVPAFAIARYPVTIAQYLSFVRASDGFSRDIWWTQTGLLWRDRFGPAVPRHDRFDNYPMTGVTWFEAVAFCRWLSERKQMNIKLPTEVQWEKAARGVDGRRYPWGNDPNDRLCNVAGTGLDEVVPVGIFPFSGAWGESTSPQDMVGNVWEWCSTKFASYPFDPQDGREDLESDGTEMRVNRGGFYGYHSLLVRCAYRGRDIPDARFDRQSFRVILESG